ncbi:MAG: chaperone NapD [Planctomycetes bacterium]|nr:chaperone NapD [Planctomycetota bacterium]
MFVGGVVVRVLPDCLEAVRERLQVQSGVQIASTAADGFALVLEAQSPDAQKAWHDEVSGWPGVREVQLVFQSSEVDG